MSSMPSTAALPRVAIRMASSVLIQCSGAAREGTRDIGGHAHGLEHVLVVGGGGAVCADPDPDAMREGGADIGDAAAEAEIGAGIMRDGNAARGEYVELFGIQPDAVRSTHAGTEQAEPVQIVRQRRAVTAKAASRWTGDSARWVCRGRPYSAASAAHSRRKHPNNAAEWWGRCRGGCASRSKGQVAAAARICAKTAAEAGRAQCGGALLRVRREGLEKAGDRFVKTTIGDHRGDDGADADFRIALRGGEQRLRRGAGQGEGEVETARAAFAQHFHGIQLGGEFAVLIRAEAVEGRRGVEQKFERNAVGHTFRERAMGMGVGVDQAGDQQPPVRRDGQEIAGGDGAGRREGRDRIAAQDDVRGPDAGILAQHQAAGDDAGRHPAAAAFAAP